MFLEVDRQGSEILSRERRGRRAGFQVDHVTRKIFLRSSELFITYLILGQFYSQKTYFYLIK